tara:strand:+ start:13990 stop:14751 length:762 start_codon:yes stop_codon:yes gene_type:complete
MKYVVIITLLFGAFVSYSQPNKYKKGQSQEQMNLQKDADWKLAIELIGQLKDGAILVALDFKKKEIAYFEKYENIKEATKIREEQQEINLQIMHSFDSLFTYCEVYFFDSDDLRHFVNKQIDSIKFYNKQCQIDNSIALSQDFFLVGNFGHVEQISSSDSIYNSSKNSLSAFVLRDENLVQLRNPFPFYSQFHPLGSVKKRYNMPVRKLQNRLESYEQDGITRYNRRETRRVKRRAKLKAKRNKKESSQAKNQ